jgi:hypothetical protein
MTLTWVTLIIVALWSWSSVVIVASLDRLHKKLAAIEGRLDEIQQTATLKVAELEADND